MVDSINAECRNITVFDVETTGLPLNVTDIANLGHEILQLAIIDGNEKVQWNELYKPQLKVNWTDAELIHGISPEDVANRVSIQEHRSQIQALVDSADLLVAYNFQFDYAFLRAAGINFAGKDYCDVMRLFANNHGLHKNDIGNRFVSLKTCAEYFGYPHYQSHEALADAKATLYCYEKMRDAND